MTMNRTRILIAALAVLAGTAVALFGGVFGRESTTRARAAAPVSAADTALLSRLLAGLAGNDTQTYVTKLERRLATRKDDAETLLLLGLAYQQRARETGDPRFFTLSDRALHEAEAHPGTGALANTGLAALAVSRHRFSNALPLARA